MYDLTIVFPREGLKHAILRVEIPFADAMHRNGQPLTKQKVWTAQTPVNNALKVS